MTLISRPGRTAFMARFSDSRVRSTSRRDCSSTSICTSLNEVICHGIPDSTVLEDGDIINLDVTAYKDGMHGDTNAMFLVRGPLRGP
jgi:methionine aminopeptidase